MKYFNVTVMDRGKKRLELIKADGKMAAITSAKHKFPSSMVLKAVETAAPLEDSLGNLLKGFKKSFKSKIPINDKISTIRQIAVMTDAGIAINDTLEDVADNTSNQELKHIYMTMNSDINAGKSLADAMTPYTEEFGHVALAMTNLGERTGNISESYHKLADIMETIRDNTAKFKKAIRSPLITLTAMGIAFTILIMVVVPKFKDIFARFKTELPVPTQILLKLEWALSNYGILILAILFGGIFALKYFYKNNRDFKYQMDKMMIHPRFYLINKAIFLSTMHKYNLVFGELVKAGIPVSEALETAVGMVDNLAIKEKLLTVNANIGRGMNLAEAFAITGLYENMLLQMIKAGEAGGSCSVYRTYSDVLYCRTCSSDGTGDIYANVGSW
jgi:general secretion pathway protein F